MSYNSKSSNPANNIIRNVAPNPVVNEHFRDPKSIEYAITQKLMENILSLLLNNPDPLTESQLLLLYEKTYGHKISPKSIGNWKVFDLIEECGRDQRLFIGKSVDGEKIVIYRPPSPLNFERIHTPIASTDDQYASISFPTKKFFGKLSCFESLEKFYMQNTENLGLATAKMDQMLMAYKEFVKSSSFNLNFGIKVGSPCCILANGKVYRAIVKGMPAFRGDLFTVFLVDTGETVSNVKEIAPLLKQFLSFPTQAIPCTYDFPDGYKENISEKMSSTIRKLLCVGQCHCTPIKTVDGVLHIKIWVHIELLVALQCAPELIANE